jgi:hypothetical protein
LSRDSVSLEMNFRPLNSAARSIATSANRETTLLSKTASDARRASELVPHRTLSRPSRAAPTSWNEFVASLAGVHLLGAICSDRISSLLIYLGQNLRFVRKSV